VNLIEARKVRMVETKGRRTEGGRRQKARTEGTKERRRKEEDKTKERKGNKCKKDSRRMRNLGQGGRSGKIRRRGKKVGTKMIPQVDQGFWKENK